MPLKTLTLSIALLLSHSVHAATLSTHLQRLQADYQRHVSTQPAQTFKPSSTNTAKVENDKVVITVTVNKHKSVEAVKKSLKKQGMTQISQYKQLLSGLFPIHRLNRLERVANVSWVDSHSAAARGARGGIAYNAGDTAMFSDMVKKKYNVSGKGITIGVMSDSYDCLGGAAADVTSGDLPNNVKVLKEYPFCIDGTDEGRAMMQLIHDVAPDATLLFYTATVSPVDFAQGIQTLTRAGANIIVDDIGWLTMPMFQDDPISQAVNEAKTQGVSYFSAAGNNWRLSYQNNVVSGKNPISQDTAHNFGKAENASNPDDFYQPITIPKGTNVKISLQWDDPSEISGGKGAATDLDLFLLNSTKQIIATSSQDSNIGHNPVEFINFAVPDDDKYETNYFLYISHRAGPTPKFVKHIIFTTKSITSELQKAQKLVWSNEDNAFHYANSALVKNTDGKIIEVYFSKLFNKFMAQEFTPLVDTTNKTYWLVPTNFDYQISPAGEILVYASGTNTPEPTIDRYVTQSSSIFGQPNAEGAIAVGAISYSQTPWFNTAISNSLVENFTSAGGTPTFFDSAGNRLAQAQYRRKPEIVAPDDIDTTFFGSDTEINNLPNFKGTSAAAPNAAAVAALLLEAYPYLTPDNIKTAMMQGSIDLKDPENLPAPTTNNLCRANSQFDWLTGCGLVQADLVFDVASVNFSGVYLSLTTSKPSLTAGQEMEYRFKLLNQTASDLKNVRIVGTDTPTQVSFESVTGCTSYNTAANFTCNLGVLKARQSADVVVKVKAQQNTNAQKLLFAANVLSDDKFDTSNSKVSVETPIRIVVGDFNSDGCVDSTDYGMLFSVFRSGIGDLKLYDLTADNAVTLADLDKLKTLYSVSNGQSCS